MRDLTKNSISAHIAAMSMPIALSMALQIAHQFVALHFVSQLGAAAVAGVNAGGHVTFAAIALVQMLSIGTTSLVAQAAGRKDLSRMNELLNQSLGLSFAFGIAIAALTIWLVPVILGTLLPDPAVAEAAMRFVRAQVIGNAVVFPMVVLSAAMRGAGLVRIPSLIFTATVILDIVFVSILVPGRGPISQFGVDGAGAASSLALCIGCILMYYYLRSSRNGLAAAGRLLTPKMDAWRHILSIGLPASVDLILMFLTTMVVYVAIREAGASAQAGFGIGFRILQLALLPGLAIGNAATSLVGQNYGAGNVPRVKEAFVVAAIFNTAAMLILTFVIYSYSTALISPFDTDASTAATAEWFLKVMSSSLVAQGIVYVCTSMFQGLGNTVPALASSMARFCIFSISTLWISRQPDFQLHYIWYLMTSAVVVQAATSLWLLHLEFRKRLSTTHQHASRIQA